MIESNLHEFIQKIPKIELHVHLEGSIQPQTALDFMRRNNEFQAPEHLDDVQQLYRFDDLTQFVTAMRSVSNNIIKLDDLGRVTHELFKTLAAQNVRYIEFDCAVQKYINLGFALPDIIEAIYGSASLARKENKIESRLIINLVRSHGKESAAKLVENVAALNHPFIIGIGLSGDETQTPQSEFIRPYAIAKEAGLCRTVHAGEAVGPESIWDAVKFLFAQRIDHGTTAIKDNKLMNYLRDHRIPLTQCLSSNLRLKVVPDITQHPFKKFFQHGLLVSLHTDDPQVFATTLNNEYVLAAEAFSFSQEEIIQIVMNGVQSSFLQGDEKSALVSDIEKELLQLRNIA